jgi:hypothetical protein
MKRIVLLTDPHRMNSRMARRLRALFPECDLQIVPVTRTVRTSATRRRKQDRAPGWRDLQETP